MEKRLLYGALGVAALWLGAKLLPAALPFLLGYVLAKLIAPAVRLVSRRLPRWLASFLCMSALLGVLGTALWLLGKLLIGQVAQLAEQLPAFLEAIPMEQIRHQALSLVQKLPDSLAPAATEWMERFFSGSSVILDTLSDRLLTFAADVVSQIPNIVLFLLTSLLSAFLISGELPGLRAWARQRLPEEWRVKWAPLRDRIRRVFGRWLLAQGKLMLMTFLLVTAGLLILRQPSALLLGLVVALVDALPVFGTGTILIPWGILTLLQGNPYMGIGLLVVYAVVTVARTVLEPRIVGRQIGLHPLLTLIALYAGFRLYGFAGMILLPIGALLAQQGYDLLRKEG